MRLGDESRRWRAREPPHPEEAGLKRVHARLYTHGRRLEGWGGAPPSCFETPRHSVSMTRVNALEARLLSMRAGEGSAPGEASQRVVAGGEATCECKKSSRSPIHCFRLFLTMEKATRACEPPAVRRSAPRTRSLPSPLWGGRAKRAGWGWCSDASTLAPQMDPHPQPLPSRSRVYPTSANLRCRTRASPGSVGRGADRVRRPH